MVSRGQRARRRGSDYEVRMGLAVEELRENPKKSIKAVADAHKVARQTLSDRINGVHNSHHESRKNSRVLNEAQERVVNEWLVQNSVKATPLHPRDLCARVSEITGKLPGKNWHRRYLQRHGKTLKASKPRHLDPKRAQNFNRTNVDGYFRLRAQIERQYNGIPPQHNWNQDEKGNQMGGGRNGIGMKYIYSAEDKECYRQHCDNLELVTILECASAAGDIMPPYFVLKTGPLPDPRDPSFDGMGGLATSDNGWTDRDIFEHWFTSVFIPEAEKHRVDPEKPIVLTLDGHDSHETRQLKRAAYRHNIIIIALPSKTTHKLQPLDVGVFSSVQRQWSKHCDERLVQGVRIDRFNFIPEYLTTRRNLTPSLVQKAFVKTGIYPLNPTIFHELDFAPSQASSSLATFPPSYPDEIPSSPSYIPSDSEMDDTEGLEDQTDSSLGPPSRMDETSESESGSLADTDDEGGLRSADNCRVTRSMSNGALNQRSLPLLPSYTDFDGYTMEKLYSYMQSYRSQCETILGGCTAQLDAANAHCTIARHHITTLTEQLANKSQAKQRKSKKVQARFVTLPELRATFEAEDAELEAKEKAESEKAAKKKADETARSLRIDQEIKNRVFDSPLASYRRKDDLVALAGALELPNDGNIAELTKLIKDHLAKNPSRANEPRFCALFGISKRRSTQTTTSSAVAAHEAGPSEPTPSQIAPNLEQAAFALVANYALPACSSAHCAQDPPASSLNQCPYNPIAIWPEQASIPTANCSLDLSFRHAGPSSLRSPTALAMSHNHTPYTGTNHGDPMPLSYNARYTPFIPHSNSPYS